MFRLGHLVNGEWLAHSYSPIFEVDDRITATVPDGSPAVFQQLVESTEPPYFLLYLLHTPRGEARPGRYQSPPISREELEIFLRRFTPFLSEDGRFDLWAHSPSENATVVWDRHNLIFAYGPLEKFSEKLRELGFKIGHPTIPAPHTHYYRSELDELADEMMESFEWSYSPLQPGDEQ